MEKTKDELQQGALAAPVVSYDGNIGTLRHMEGNILQKPGLLPGVGEIKMVYGQHDGSFINVEISFHHSIHGQGKMGEK